MTRHLKESVLGESLVSTMSAVDKDLADLLEVRKQLWTAPSDKTLALYTGFHTFSHPENQPALMMKHLSRFASKHKLKNMSRNHLAKASDSVMESYTGSDLINITRFKSLDAKGRDLTLLSMSGAEIQGGKNPVYDVVLSGSSQYLTVLGAPLTLCFTHHFLQRFDERSGLRDAKPTLRSFMEVLMKYPFKLVFTTQRSGAWFKSYFCVKLPDRILFIAAPCMMFLTDQSGKPGTEKYVIFMKTILDSDDERFIRADAAHNLARDWDAMPTSAVLLYAANYNSPSREDCFEYAVDVLKTLKEELCKPK